MDEIETRLAHRLASLRSERGWSLDELAQKSAVSRASLSRIEKGEVSPTASVLGKLCVAFGVTLSRLMQMVEDDFGPLVMRADQEVWTDPDTGYRRRLVSPTSKQLSGEVIEVEIGPDQRIEYDGSPRDGLEHHLVMLEGALAMQIDGQTHQLRAGDCLRYLLRGGNVFQTPPDQGAKYHLFIID
ncbi:MULTISPECIES: helix-turn-helix domain-containing protein [Thalassospira]|uniref:XRE family transcriptional regulator n=1 Tax=Thalassospira profundimaris TaxID=502049 RepID=A0A367V441_9PROT|nr:MULTISPECIES: helix-turn-helix transcriptional regulator [Thalassospira]KZB69523.1 XRE family transcriptional regulator [Thalassospira sp. MCCC 1A01148]MBR9900717.1 helix-turn-helix domain-containing protein [Rhodospirillales bacterium]MBS8272057.1 XRE family transcriptional regulator [Thalassospira tepidiphila]RCK19152.1 XRE family transcriptional regulator [Thalassospira profundimaris]